MSIQTPDYIANLLAQRSRELHVANNDKMTTFSQDHSQNHTSPREVYNNKNIEIQNYSSRENDEDVIGDKVSVRPAFCPEAYASKQAAFDSVSDPLASPTCQKAFVSNITPARTTSRYTGIIVQQVRTERGIKVAITLQKPEWQSQGAVQLATAELKRYDRLREVKARPDDSESFNQYLTATKQTLQAERNQNACLGRLHQRAKRSKWLYDTLVVGFLENNQIARVLLYLEGEEYVIELSDTMNKNQTEYYISQGIEGTIINTTHTPRLDDLPLVKFGG